MVHTGRVASPNCSHGPWGSTPTSQYHWAVVISRQSNQGLFYHVFSLHGTLDDVEVRESHRQGTHYVFEVPKPHKWYRGSGESADVVPIVHRVTSRVLIMFWHLR